MADKILFKKGTFNQLKEVKNVVNNAFYITTDEPGIYLGVNGELKRFGDFQLYKSVSDLQQAARNHNLSKTALYYVSEGNYLLRFNGTDFEWINDLTPIKNYIGLGTNPETDTTSLTAKLTTVEGAISSQDEALKSITGTTSISVAENQGIVDIIGDENSGVDGKNIKSLKALTADLSNLTGGSSGSVSTQINDLKDSIIGSSDNSTIIPTSGTAVSTLRTLDKKFNDANDKIEEIEGQIENITKTGTGILDTAKGYTNTEIDKLEKTIEDADYWTTKEHSNFVTETIGSKGSDSGIAASTIWEALKENRSAIKTNEGAISDLDIKIINEVGSKSGSLTAGSSTVTVSKQTSATDYATEIAQKAYDKAVDHANSLLKASHAMIFKGAIPGSAISNLSNGQTGDTYVISSASGDYNPGDLIVWTETDDEGQWTKIDTGYDVSHNPKLNHSLGGNVLTTNLTSMESATKGNLGYVELAVDATDTNLTLTEVNTIPTISLEWGTF